MGGRQHGSGAADPRGAGDGGEGADRSEIRAEAVHLKSQIPNLRHQRDVIRVELVGLMNEVSTLRRERNELAETTTQLGNRVRDLRQNRQELEGLRSEIQVLRREKSRLDKELLAVLRQQTAEDSASTPTTYQRFHDS